jgi:hypothetical protein
VSPAAYPGHIEALQGAELEFEGAGVVLAMLWERACIDQLQNSSDVETVVLVLEVVAEGDLGRWPCWSGLAVLAAVSPCELHALLLIYPSYTAIFVEKWSHLAEEVEGVH